MKPSKRRVAIIVISAAEKLLTNFRPPPRIDPKTMQKHEACCATMCASFSIAFF
jgi:hypothetical protein